MRHRVNASLLTLFFAVVILAGCATRAPSGRQTGGMPIFTKRTFDYKTTSLFIKPCENEDEKKKADKNKSSDDFKDKHKKKKKGWFSSLFSGGNKEDKDEKPEKKKKSADCKIVDIERMIAVFNGIPETDEAKGIKGATIEEVRKVGFTIYADEKRKTNRKNTESFYGNEALKLIGMDISPPQLGEPEKIEAYNNYMKSIYGEAYYETDLEQVSDRICINTDETRVVGSNRTFAFVWKGDHVFKRVIKGKYDDRTVKEEALFKCPGGFLGRTIEGGASRARDLLIK